MTPNELQNIAHQFVIDKIGKGEVVQMHWAVQELILQQGEIMGDGVAFYRLCAQKYVYHVMKTAVDKYGKPKAEEQQLTLRGYECLEEAYTVERNGKIVLIPIDQITDDELLLRAIEFERQSDGLVKHAEEIRRYVADRQRRAGAVMTGGAGR